MVSFIRCCALFAAVFGGCVSPFPAGAGNIGHSKDIEQRIAALATEAGALGVDLSLLKDIEKSMKSTLETETAMDVWEEAQYQLDHAVLDNVVWNDITEDIKKLYSSLSSMRTAAFSFMDADAAEVSFARQYPGYRARQTGGYVHFAQEYKNRIDGSSTSDGGLQGYLEGVLKANNSEFLAVQKAQENIRKLKDASDNAGFYRKMWQAGDQIVNVVNQEFSQLRIDIQRHLDAEIRYALNEQQEKADAQAAFEWAVQEWKAQSSGKGY
ncbi:MAG: hypothetical protein LBR71_05760 [Synergistaceae bacterium]|jgi:conjugal transfer/entry exclusion protein|nr:hypothetical protein [Synergistaceae bacterium]